jgi:hypothetical protein
MIMLICNSMKSKSIGKIYIHSTKLYVSSTIATHSAITHNYFRNTVLDTQYTKKSAFIKD